MIQNTKIAIIGGTGKSGQYLIRQLITRKVYFKMLVRNPKNGTIGSPFAEIVRGDVSNIDTVRNLLSGCNAVISLLGSGIPPSKPTIFSTGTQNVLSVMQEFGLKRYVVATGLNVNTVQDQKSPKTQFATDWMYQNFPKSTKDRQDEYELLVASQCDWTLVRLPVITLTEERMVVKTRLNDCEGDHINAGDLADFLISQLTDTTFYKEAPFLFN